MNERPRNQHYQVPRRFGLRTVLVVTAMFGLMLSVVNWTGASPIILIFYTSFVVLVGTAQVILERSPRLGSMLAGAVILPLLNLSAIVFGNGLEPLNNGLLSGLFAEDQFVYSMIFGAFYGYLSGTLLAGLYLVSDKLQFMIRRGSKQRRMRTEMT